MHRGFDGELPRNASPPREVSEAQSPIQNTQPETRRRFFADADSNPWEVREAKNPDYDRRGGYSLIFESPGLVRRVRNYPADWFDLSVADLRDLIERI